MSKGGNAAEDSTRRDLSSTNLIVNTCSHQTSEEGGGELTRFKGGEEIVGSLGSM